MRARSAATCSRPRARTVSGSINVGLPLRADGRVALSTLRGTVSVDLELEERQEREGRITGRMNGGIGTFDLSSVTGNVRLAEYRRDD